MGQFALIDTYMDVLRQSVDWRPDSDDVVAELTDHLTVSVEREIALGIDPVDAQRVSLDRFGEPRLVSRAFASTYSGGVAVPTQFTKRSGLVAMIGAGSMLVFLIAWIIQIAPALERDGIAPADILPYAVWGPLSVVAFGGVALLVLGLKKRHGGSLGPWAWVSFGLAAASTVPMVAPWMIFVGAPLTGLAALIIGVLMLREGAAPTLATVMFTTGLLLSVGIWVITDLTNIGTTDYWGEPVLSRIVAFGAMGVLFVPGYFLLGRWLHGESAVDEVDTPLIAG